MDLGRPMGEGLTDNVGIIRLNRIGSAGRFLEARLAKSLSTRSPLHAVVSSRIARDSIEQHRLCRYLISSLLSSRTAGARVLIASGSAIEPWAKRACELLAIPTLVISTDSQVECDCVIRSDGYSRDRLVVDLADRVDVIHVRAGGEIERCVTDRVQRLRDGSTRVVVSGKQPNASQSLIRHGAIGWYDLGRDEPFGAKDSRRHPTKIKVIDRDWMSERDKWLIHCTRGRHGPWPEETLEQYRDTILLGDRCDAERGPMQSLRRILRSGRLMASAVTSSHKIPVVCFSAVPLLDLTKRRCFRSHLGRWDYEPFGIAIARNAATRIGIRPVIYGSGHKRSQIAAENQFRFQAIGRKTNWTTEEEWRSPRSIDLFRIDPDDVRVFVGTPADLHNVPRDCRWSVTCVHANSD